MLIDFQGTMAEDQMKTGFPLIGKNTSQNNGDQWIY